MPRCRTCGIYLHGSDHYCELHISRYHRSRPQKHYKNNSDPVHPGDLYFRVPRNDRVHNNAVALYKQRHTERNGTTLSPLDTPLAYTLAQSFAVLQDTHIINAVSYNVSPSGAQTLNVEANLDREQCPICTVWFANREKLGQHRVEYPVGCEKHGVCMREEDMVWHALIRVHERCFVRDCRSIYRIEGGWKNRVIQKHVERYHCY